MNYELEGGPQEPGARSCRAGHSAVAERKFPMDSILSIATLQPGG